MQCPLCCSARPWDVFLRGWNEVLRAGLWCQCVSVFLPLSTGLRPHRGCVQITHVHRSHSVSPANNYTRSCRLYCGSAARVRHTGVTQLNSSLLIISVIAVLLPAAFHVAAGAQIPDGVETKDILAVSHGVSSFIDSVRQCLSLEPR